jgi:hypothetical protein
VVRVLERPWLTREAAAQIVGPEGGLGPIFSDVALGGPAPAPAVRARIADFARANAIDIDFEVIDGELAAARFAVTFGGCCGYEGADALARRFGRPWTQSCCGCSRDWVDDWSVAREDGVHIRGRVRVNRVEVRWERTMSAAELLDRADRVIGETRARVGKAAGDRWTELDPGQRYRLEVPYPFTRSSDVGLPVKLDARDDLGLQIVVERGRIAEVSFALRGDDAMRELLATPRASWGRPRITGDDPKTFAWRTRARRITAELDGAWMKVVIRALPGSLRSGRSGPRDAAFRRRPRRYRCCARHRYRRSGRPRR